MTPDNEPKPYLFFEKQWMCFEGELPVKPNSYDYPTEGWKAHEENAAWEKYNQAIATLKSKALVVANPEITYEYIKLQKEKWDKWLKEYAGSRVKTEGLTETVYELYPETKNGEIYEWPGTVMVDKCWQPESYTLYLPKPDMSEEDKWKDQDLREAWNAAIDACIKFISDNDSFIKSELEELKK